MHDADLKKMKPPTILDNTIRSTFADCPRKLYWFLRRFDYASKPTYFTFGSAWQETMLAWHADSGLSWEERFANALERGLNYWDSEGEDGPAPNSKEVLVQLFTRYTEKYPDEPWRVVAGETGFTWPIATVNGIEYSLGGALDSYIEWSGYGVLILENKTTGMYITDSYLRQWSCAPQVTGYIWVLSQLQGKPAFGCLMNVASKKLTKEPEKGFTRTLEKRNTGQLRQFQADWRYFIEDLNRAWERWVWPLTTNPINCAGGIGRSPCLYQQLCFDGVPFQEVNPHLVPGIVERTELWEPWKRSGKQEAE